MVDLIWYILVTQGQGFLMCYGICPSTQGTTYHMDSRDIFCYAIPTFEEHIISWPPTYCLGFDPASPE